MKLSTRLWLLGALLPVVVMLVALVIAGQVFRAALESSLDRALLAQGAAESVSLFDRVDGPHLHMAESPLLEEVRPFAPTGALFDSQGRLIAHFPPLPHPDDSGAGPALDGPASELRTEGDGAGRFRVLLVRAKNDAGERYVLRLTASLEQVDESVRTFYLVALLVVLITGLILLAAQGVLGRRLAQRLGALSVHLQKMQKGQLDEAPAPDGAHDEIAALREVLASATEQLKTAREGQDRLLAEAAHELRTPLTVMRTTLDLALRRERTPAELREALSEARTEAERLARLATALLDRAAAQRGWDRTVGDLSVVIDDAVEGMKSAAEDRGLWFDVSLERPASARFHAMALRQALDNVFGNALRFAPRGTAIEVRLARQAERWRLSVRDFGPGIAEAERERVFAPFHRLENTGGAGLGLAIAREVLREHQGSIEALAPESGSGALLVIELPVET